MAASTRPVPPPCPAHSARRLILSARPFLPACPARSASLLGPFCPPARPFQPACPARFARPFLSACPFCLLALPVLATCPACFTSDRPEQLFRASAGSEASAESEAGSSAGSRSYCLKRRSCLCRTLCSDIYTIINPKLPFMEHNVAKVEQFGKEMVPKLTLCASVQTASLVQADASVLLLSTESWIFFCSCSYRSSCLKMVQELWQNHAQVDVCILHACPA